MSALRTEQHALVLPPEVDGLRLDQALAQVLEQYSRSMLKDWIDAGQVRLNGAPTRPRARVAAGDRVEVTATLAAAEQALAAGHHVVHRRP